MANNTITRRVNLYINGKEAGNDIKSVKGEMQKLINEQARMKVGSIEYVTAGKRIRELKSVLDQHNAQLRATEKNWFSLGKMADGFNKYFGIITAGIASFTGMVLGFRKLSEEVAKMDDVYSDVSKTTNLTRKEVVALNEEFKKMDTRTSRESLNNLAADAGKLGISGKKDILEFVEAGNQINVALGEDLGEGAIKNIGKITQVFKRSTEELRGMGLKEQMLSVGSAINELGQSSTASEAYLVNFAQRLGGVASQAGISVQNILGYASALDQSGQAVEMSATALQNFIMKIMGDPAKFAKLAGKDVKEFTNLLKTDTNAAIIQVLTSLNSKGGFQALIPVFEEMGLDGARAVGVLSSLASNINMVTEAQEVSNRGFAEASSITGEYDKKNNNLQATLEKSRKAFNEQALTLGEKLSPLMIKSTNSMTMLIKALSQAPEFIKENRSLLIGLGGALVSLVALSAGAAIQTSVLSAKTSVLNGVKRLYNTISGETLMQKERENIANQVYVEELSKTITKEQAAALQKQGLSKTSKEYSEQLHNTALRNLSSTQANVKTLRQEVTALSTSVEMKKKASLAATNLVEQRRYEVYWAKQSGNAVKIATAEKRLEEAIDKKSAASKIYVSTARQFHSKKIQLETTAQRANTLSTQINTATDTANVAAKQALFSVTTKLTTAMKALWLSMKSNPLGWLSAAVSAVMMFNSKTEKSGEIISRFNVVSKEAFEKTSKAIDSNSIVIDQLIGRYNALKSVTNPTNEQQAELRDIIQKIAELVPSATIAVDEYNKSLDISTGKAIDYSKKQKEILSELSGKNATEWIDELYNGSKKMYVMQEELSKGLKFSDFWGFSQDEKLSASEKMVTEKELDNMKIKRDVILQLLSSTGIAEKELRTELMDMFSMTSGFFSNYEGAERDNTLKYFDQYFAKQNYLLEQKNKQPGSPVTNNTAILKEISLLTDKQKLQEYILNQDKEISASAQARLNVLNSAGNGEIKKINGLIEAKEAELKLAQEMPGRTMQEIIARNQKVKSIQKEIEALRNLGVEDENKKAAELVKEKEKMENDLAQKITEIRSKLHLRTLSDSEKEVFEAQQKYNELLGVCQKYGLDATNVLDAYSQEMDQIFEDSMLKEVSEVIAAQEKINDVLMSSSDKEKSEIRQKYADLIELAEKNGIDTVDLRKQLNDKMNEEMDGGGKKSGGADLFGMSEENWEEMGGKITMALDMAGQLSDIWGQANQIQSNREQKELQEYEKNCNKKKEILNKQLNAGRISQEQYNARVSQIDADLDKKKAETAKKEAKRNKLQSIFSTAINTASAIVQALNAPPPASFVFAALAGAMGLAQAAVIASTPLPEYAEGGMTAGAKMYVAGEAGQEWISPNWMLNDKNTGPVIKRLEMVRSGILSPEQLVPIVPDFQSMTSVPLFASGGYTSPENMQNNYYTTETNPIVSIPELSDMNENIRILCEYLADPRNRQASISNDLLRKNDEEMNFMNRLKRL